MYIVDGPPPDQWSVHQPVVDHPSNQIWQIRYGHPTDLSGSLFPQCTPQNTPLTLTQVSIHPFNLNLLPTYFATAFVPSVPHFLPRTRWHGVPAPSLPQFLPFPPAPRHGLPTSPHKPLSDPISSVCAPSATL
ncbi:hypothetical protein JB92DRAFT_1355332 [Gautieria morchelliformis]|nr:hypothetical protein JB92DRAFT_1355332 [Gautieria morchelliformis]